MSGPAERRAGDGHEAPKDPHNPGTTDSTGTQSTTTESSVNTDYPHTPDQWNTGAIATPRGELHTFEFDPNLTPNPTFLAQMVEMGIPASTAIQALIQTKNSSAGRFHDSFTIFFILIDNRIETFIFPRNCHFMGVRAIRTTSTVKIP